MTSLGLKALGKISLTILFPTECFVCQKPLSWRNEGPVCSICLQNLPLIQEPVCYQCGHPIEANIGHLPPDKISCDFCRQYSWPFVLARSIFRYEGSVRELIHNFKYQRKLKVGHTLAKAMLNSVGWLEPYLKDIDGIVPVPIGMKKLRQREFNQSMVLGKTIGQAINVPVFPYGLKKSKETIPQVELSRQERIKNIRGSFTTGKEETEIYNKEILLVDDVFTTGATVAECSRILRQHGVKGVRVLTLARTIVK